MELKYPGEKNNEFFRLTINEKIKSHRNDFFYLYMAFQEGFEPPTDSLEGILLNIS